MDKVLVSLAKGKRKKKKREKTQITTIRKERGGITTNITERKRMIRIVQ